MDQDSEAERERARFHDHEGLRSRRARVLRRPPVEIFPGERGAAGLEPWLSELAEVVDMELVLLGHVNSATYTTCAYFSRSGDPSIRKGDTIPIGETYCRQEIVANDIFLLPDALADRAFQHHPGLTVHGLRSYVGFPLRLPNDVVFGTLCAVDTRPRHVHPEALDRLRELAGQVSAEIGRRLVEARLSYRYVSGLEDPARPEAQG